MNNPSINPQPPLDFKERPDIEKLKPTGYLNNVICGDLKVVLRSLESDSVDCIITSPPYYQQRGYTGIGIGCGQERTLDDYLESLLEVFDEMVRVIKTTGSIFYNLGDKINQNKGQLLVPYRFAIGALGRHQSLSLVNEITWMKKNPTPRQFSRRLVSATEPFFHFSKSKDYYYAIDRYFEETRVINNNPSSNLGMRYVELIASSRLSKAEKANATEALNVVINEVKLNRILGFRMKIRGIHAPAFGGQEGGRNIQMNKKGFTIIRINGGKLKKDYIETAVESPRHDIKHPAVFPLKIIEELIELSCPDKGLVLDPYCGSGTTLVAAKKRGRNYLGIDISPEYCVLSKKRVEDIYIND